MNTRCLLNLLAALAVSLNFTPLAHAAPGDVDSLVADVTGAHVLGSAQQPDGKTIIIGTFTAVNGVLRNNIARLNVDGSLDTAFDPNTSSPDAGNGRINAMAVQPDGKIVLGGYFTELQPNGAPAPTARRHLARINADGTLDTSFGDFQIDTPVLGLAAQPDGKLLLWGYFSSISGSTRRGIARLNADGTLDTGFDPNPLNPNDPGNNYVFAAAVQGDGKVLLGGGFTSLDPNAAGSPVQRRYFARVNDDGTVDMGFDPSPNVRVFATRAQPDGKVLLSGDFNALEPNGGPSTTRNHIARVNADGTLDTGFNPDAPIYEVNSIALQADGQVLFTGGFDTVQGTTRNRVARVAANGTLDANFDPNLNGGALSVTLQDDGKVQLGGGFTTLQPNGAASPTPRSLFARVLNDPATQTLTAPDATQVLWQRGGSATELTGATFEKSLDGGATWTPLGVGTRVGTTANWQITGLSLGGQSGKLRARGITAGGYFNGSGGLIEQTGNFDTTADFTLIPTLSSVSSVAYQFQPMSVSYTLPEDAQDNTLELSFYNVVTGPQTGAIIYTIYPALGTAGARTLTFDPDSPASSMTDTLPTFAASTALVDGTYTVTLSYRDAAGHAPASSASIEGVTVGSAPQPGMVGALDAAIGTSIYGRSVYGTAVQPDGKIIIAGAFDSVLGTTRHNIARLKADGTLDANFDPNANGPLLAVAVQADGKVLVGGNFSTLQPPGAAEPIACPGFARLNSDGTVDLSFNPGLGGGLGGFGTRVTSAVVQPDGKILIGGSFALLQPNGGGATFARNGIARLNADGTVDPDFDPNPNNYVFGIALQADGKVVLWGGFTALEPNHAGGAASRSFVARVNADGTLDTFNPTFDGAVFNVAVQADGKLILGGDFTTVVPNGAVAPVNRLRVARFNTDSTLDSGFHPNANGRVNNIVVQADGKLLLGGDFTGLAPSGVTVDRLFLARVNADGTVDPNFDPHPDSNLNCLALQSDGKVLVGGSFTTLQPPGAPNPIPRDAFARLDNDAAAQSLSLNGGTEVLWQRSGSGPSLSSVTFEFTPDGGAHWFPLGGGVRVGTTENWELGSLDFTGLLGTVRARGRALGGTFNASGSLIEQTVAFDFDTTAGSTAAPILTKPEANSLTHLDVAVDFTLREAAKAGSVTLKFDDGSNGANPPIVLTLASSQQTPERHQFEFNPAAVMDATSGGAIASSTGATIPDGSYTVTLSYQDTLNHAAATAMSVNVELDNAPPALDLTPKFIAVTAIGTATMPSVSNIATDPHGISAFTQNPAQNDPLPFGQTFVEISATDGAGNTSTGFLPVIVGYERPTSPGVTAIASTSETVSPGAVYGVAAPANAKLTVLGVPAISDNRFLVAKATILDGTKKLACIYEEGTFGVAGLVALQGADAPGISGAKFKSFLDPQIAPDGKTVVFAAKVTGGGVKPTDDDGVWRAQLGQLNATIELMMREGRSLPAAGAQIKLKSVTSVSLRNDGLLALVKLARAPGLVTAADDTALVQVTAPNGAGDRLLRTSDSIGDFKVKTMTVLAPALGSPGHARWHNEGLITAKVTSTDKRTALWQFANSTMPTVVALTGDDSGFLDDQSMPDGTKWASFGLPSQCSTPMDFVAIGTLALQRGVVTKADDTAIGSAENGAFEGVLREGDLVPLIGVKWASFFDPIMNDQGETAFLGTVKGPGVTKANRTALFWGDIASAVPIARLGDPTSAVPDADGNAVTGRTWAAITSYALPFGYGSNLVFIAKVKGGGVLPASNIGLYAIDSQVSGLRELLRTSDLIGGKKVKSFTLLNAVPGSYSVSRSANRTGSLAALVTFFDKSQALVRIDIP